MKTYIFACALAVSVAVGACVSYENKTTTTSPTAGSTVDALVGAWQSAINPTALPSPTSCTNFNWTPSQQTATSVMGSFSATCPGGLKVAGNASASLSGSTVSWTAEAIASTPEIPS